VSNKEELAAATADSRLTPRWYFGVLGAAVAVSLALVRVHYLFLLLVVLVIIPLEVVRRRKGYVVEDPKSAIALRAPLPGAFLNFVINPLILIAAFIISGVFFPRSALPFWAVLVIAGAVGAVVTLSSRTAAVRQMAAIQKIERERHR
jgi:small-conductance mechanosensitive channel